MTTQSFTKVKIIPANVTLAAGAAFLFSNMLIAHGVSAEVDYCAHCSLGRYRNILNRSKTLYTRFQPLLFEHLQTRTIKYDLNSTFKGTIDE